MIPKFSIQLGGATSIDVTRPGIDKAYGVRKLHETLGIAIADMIFVGDAIFPGGNDYPAKQAGAESIRVRDPSRNQACRRSDLRMSRDREQPPLNAELRMVASLFAPAGSEPTPEKASAPKPDGKIGASTQESPDEAAAVVLEHQENRPLIDGEVERRYP